MIDVRADPDVRRTALHRRVVAVLEAASTTCERAGVAMRARHDQPLAELGSAGADRARREAAAGRSDDRATSRDRDATARDHTAIIRDRRADERDVAAIDRRLPIRRRLAERQREIADAVESASGGDVAARPLVDLLRAVAGDVTAVVEELDRSDDDRAAARGDRDAARVDRRSAGADRRSAGIDRSSSRADRLVEAAAAAQREIDGEVAATRREVVAAVGGPRRR
jgi:hypothetical protein